MWISVRKKGFKKEHQPLLSKLNDFITNESIEMVTLPAIQNTAHILNEKLQKFNFWQNKNTQQNIIVYQLNIEYQLSSLPITKYLLK